MFTKNVLTSSIQGAGFELEYLVIAGGGGGGDNGENATFGGGGAGGYRSSVAGEDSGGGASAESPLVANLGVAYTVTVGAGGGVRTDGNDSVFGAITSVGGGAGGGGVSSGTDGSPGGSGGGGGNGAGKLGGDGTASQGYAGGDSDLGGGGRGAGGGGAGAVGEDSLSANGGAGGDGVQSVVTGVNTYRAGGGGGGSASTGGVGGLGGLGGGGKGETNNSGDATAGAANTGGGGGGSFTSGSQPGGSGVVIIKLPRKIIAEFSAGVSYNYIPVDGFHVYEITAAGVSDTVTFKDGSDIPVTIDESLRFNDDDSARLTRTPSVAGDRKTWTWSGWVKRGNLTNGYLFQSFGPGGFGVDGNVGILSDKIDFIFDYNGGSRWRLVTTQVFRDPSAWYHIVVVADTTSSVSNNRLRLYVNGAAVSSFTTENYPSLNANGTLNQAYAHAIGANTTPSTHFDGYLSDVYFIDGQALDPSNFGHADDNGVWQPIAYPGTYGTNGFHLEFADNSTAAALGTDTSGNGNDWTPSGITTDDQVSDTPSVNYATLNPLNKLIVVGAGASPTFSDGNLNVNGNNQDAVGTFGVSSGKWYYEVTQQDSGAFTNGVGWYREGTSEESIYRDDGNFRFDGTEAAYGASWQSSGDIIGIALDLDNTTISFYKNGVSQGNAKTNLSAGTYIPLIYCRLPSNLTANFGQSAFTYTPPTGFVALNSANLPTPTIADGKEHFDIALYTGTGKTTRTVRGFEFQPDFVWIKNRSGSNNHILSDAVRGAGVGLASDATVAEFSIPTDFQAFLSNGFTVGYAGFNFTNGSGINYVAWNWNAGGSTVTNTDGSITSQVRANTTAGFSIVSYTGNGSANQTIGHGLGQDIDMVIVKNRDDTDNWRVWHSGLSGDTYYVGLNQTFGEFSSSTVFNGHSSTTFTVGTDPATNGNTEALIAYCFAGVDGFSKFGTYTGNGSADGPFVYTGFRPAWVMFKATSVAGESWGIMDSKRLGYNVINSYVQANSSAAEYAYGGGGADILSNGFKLRSTSTGVNGSGITFIYMAFAENPFKTARAR